jgi:hypothetical protein
MQGYSSGMLTHESRILQVTILGTVHTHLTALDFGGLLPEVMIFADEVDARSTQTMDAFTKARPKLALASVISPAASERGANATTPELPCVF